MTTTVVDYNAVCKAAYVITATDPAANKTAFTTTTTGG